MLFSKPGGVRHRKCMCPEAGFGTRRESRANPLSAPGKRFPQPSSAADSGAVPMPGQTERFYQRDRILLSDVLLGI